VSFENTIVGGASSCHDCPPGYVSEGQKTTCAACPAGSAPNSDKTKCVLCPFGKFNPKSGGECTACPEYTYSDEDRVSCQLFDSIIDSLHNNFHVYRLSDIEDVCQRSDFQAICDTNQKSLGPILLDPDSTDKTQPVFFFTNKDALDTDRFEFHKSKSSVVSDRSYVFMLYQQQDVDISLLDDYLESSTETLTPQEQEISDEFKLINQVFSDFT